MRALLLAATLALSGPALAAECRCVEPTVPSDHACECPAGATVPFVLAAFTPPPVVERGEPCPRQADGSRVCSLADWHSLTMLFLDTEAERDFSRASEAKTAADLAASRARVASVEALLAAVPPCEPGASPLLWTAVGAGAVAVLFAGVLLVTAR